MMFFLIKTSAKNPLGSFWDLQEVALEEVDSSGKYRFPFSRFQSRTREMRKKNLLCGLLQGVMGDLNAAWNIVDSRNGHCKYYFGKYSTLTVISFL